MPKRTQKKTDEIYKRWTKEHKLTTADGVKEKFDKMLKVRDRYIASRDWLKTSCPWEKTEDSDGSWFDYRERQEKAWSMWYKPLDEDGFKSNVKSPMTTGRVESAMHKIKQMNVGFVAQATEKSDKLKAKIITKILSYFFQKASVKYRLATWFKDALVYGNGIVRTYYARQNKEVRLAKKDPESMTKEEKAELKETKGAKTIFGTKETVTEYDDIVIEPINWREWYPQPSARKIQGLEYASNWFIRRRVVTFEQFLSEYEKDKNCTDVKKVKPVSEYSDEDLNEDLELPNDESEEYVEILEMEDVEKDEYIIVANDIIIRDTPLPYNHKQITYTKIGAIEHTHQFFWRGIADQLMGLQAEEEILKNMQYDMLHQKLRDSYLINHRDFNSFVEAYQKTGGRFMPVNIDGRAMEQVVQYIPQGPIDTSSFIVLDKIKQDATMATQFDPSQIGVQQKDKTATQSMIDKEVVDSFIVSTMESFGEGLIQLARQVVSLMIQFYSVPKVKKIMGEDGKEVMKKVYREFKTIDERLVLQDDDLVVEALKNDYDFFEMKGEYLDLAGDLDIQLNSETVKVKSKALDAQISQQALDKLIPFAVNPNDPDSFKKVPLPLIDAVKLMQWYVETNDIPEDLLLEEETNEQADVVRALMQNIELNNGKTVQPIPGESARHITIHDRQLGYWQNEYNGLSSEMGNLQQAGLIDQKLQGRLDDIRKVITHIMYHISGDQTPEHVGNRTLPPMEQPQQPQPPMEPPMNPMGPGMGMPPEMMGQQQAMPPMPGGMPPGAPQGGGQMMPMM